MLGVLAMRGEVDLRRLRLVVSARLARIWMTRKRRPVVIYLVSAGNLGRRRCTLMYQGVRACAYLIHPPPGAACTHGPSRAHLRSFACAPTLVLAVALPRNAPAAALKL